MQCESVFAPFVVEVEGALHCVWWKNENYQIKVKEVYKEYANVEVKITPPSRHVLQEAIQELHHVKVVPAIITKVFRVRFHTAVWQNRYKKIETNSLIGFNVELRSDSDEAFRPGEHTIFTPFNMPTADDNQEWSPPVTRELHPLYAPPTPRENSPLRYTPRSRSRDQEPLATPRSDDTNDTNNLNGSDTQITETR